jgi:hypothetical protein
VGWRSVAMGRAPREGGLLIQQRPRYNAESFWKAVSDVWFSSWAAFHHFVLYSEIDMPSCFSDHIAFRGILLWMHFGLVQPVNKCPRCRGQTCLRARSSGGGWTTYAWTCKTVGHKHFEQPLNGQGWLRRIPINSCLPFFAMIVLLIEDFSWKKIADELRAVFRNIDTHTIQGWREYYQDGLESFLELCGSLTVGGRNEVVVIDETVVGVAEEDGYSLAPKGIRKAKPQIRTTSRSKRATKARVEKTLPARTIWKKQPVMKSVLKKPARKRGVAGTPKDPRSNGAWLWVAVVVGKSQTRYTHENGLKRITYKFLPRRADALDGKPRGLGEIRKVLQERVHKHSFLVFDKWKATVAAVRDLGFQHAPPVNHSIGYRDRESGFHSNDVESENSRLKHWSRARYGRLNVTEREMAEYTFYVNHSKKMSAVMEALARLNGGKKQVRKFW